MRILSIILFLLTCVSLVGEDAFDEGRHFLKKHMPSSDQSTNLDDLIETNLKYAYKARDTFEWAKKVPEEIFLNDVLPYAVLDERRDDWRKDFYGRFSKIVAPAKTQKEAIFLINAAIEKELKVKYSTQRKKANQSPYESMEQGMASCTGLSILLVDAFRAVGIPARVAGIPAWTTKRGNHNWVEVWLLEDEQWHFTEYYPDAKGLDHSWFVNDAAQADPNKPMHRIYASSWKKSDTTFPLVWNLSDKSVHAVDVTQRYLGEGAKPKYELRIEAVKAGERKSIPIHVMFDGNGKVAAETPKATDDANAYFTFYSVKSGTVKLTWESSQNGMQTAEIMLDEEIEYFTIEL